MRRMRRIMSLLVVFMLLFSTVAMAKGPSDSKKAPKTKTSVKTEKAETSAKSEKTADSKKNDKADKVTTSAEGEKNSSVPANATKGKQPQFVAEKKAYKAELKELKKEMKALVKNGYTVEELQQITDKAKALEAQYPGIKAMPVESIISNKAMMKFDVPPVIKEGRMLVPVRAITEGMGASVEWNQEEQSVTITKDGTEIVIKLGEGTAAVNGTQTELGVTAQTYNNRTFVPLRFIAESLGLNVEWDEETQTVEIDEEEPVDTEEALEPSDGGAVVEDQADLTDSGESTEIEQEVEQPVLGDIEETTDSQQPEAVNTTDEQSQETPIAADEASAAESSEQTASAEVQP